MFLLEKSHACQKKYSVYSYTKRDFNNIGRLRFPVSLLGLQNNVK